MPLFSRKHFKPGGYNRRSATYCYYISPALLTVILLLRISIFQGRKPPSSSEHISVSSLAALSVRHGARCISWRQTDHCTPDGVRRPEGDKYCGDWIDKGPGYCECSSGRIVQRTKCGRGPGFRCQDACKALADEPSRMQRLPSNVTCTSGSPLARGQVHIELSSHKDHRETANGIWIELQAALQNIGTPKVVLPQPRTELQDWVREGSRLPRRDIEIAKEQWKQFLLAAPDYPAGQFEGQGVVILAGSPQYMVPAWVNVRSLRRAGCKLQIQVIFPANEAPTEELVSILESLGATCASMPKSLDTVIARATGETDTPMAGFMLKIAAIILSTFQEVIFLDSDNVAIADVGQLFETPQYTRYGALLWPDYWESSAAPDLLKILGLEEAPLGTTESGQMVFDKARVWDALMLAAYFNMHSGFYYELFSNFMGKGDKESFAFAFAATRTPYFMVPYAVGSVGQMRSYCSPDHQYCWEEFTGNTMVQHDLKGNMLFLHTNLSPKWNLHIPGDFRAYSRRWQVFASKRSFADIMTYLGYDIEYEVWRSLVDFRCSAVFTGYTQVHVQQVVFLVQQHHAQVELPSEQIHGLGTFHPQNEGVNFRQAYRWGLRGPYLQFTQVNLGDVFQHWKNGKLQPCLGRFLRIWRGRERIPYFV